MPSKKAADLKKAGFKLPKDEKKADALAERIYEAQARAGKHQTVEGAVSEGLDQLGEDLVAAIDAGATAEELKELVAVALGNKAQWVQCHVTDVLARGKSASAPGHNKQADGPATLTPGRTK